MGPTVLSGSQVCLREITCDDVCALFAVVGDERVTKWLSFDTRTQAETEGMVSAIVTAARESDRREYALAVVEQATDQLVGFARLGLTGVQAAKLGYAIRADRWGRGYATEAARLLTDYAFGELDLERVTAAIGPDNEASINVVTRIGMKQEGRLRHHVFTNGAWRDSLLYSVLTGEWVREGSS